MRTNACFSNKAREKMRLFNYNFCVYFITFLNIFVAYILMQIISTLMFHWMLVANKITQRLVEHTNANQ